MTIADDIKTAMRSVITLLGDPTWRVRILTSNNDAEARAYGNAALITAQLVSQTTASEYDDKKRTFVKRRRAVIKVSDAITYKIGDEFIDPDGSVWHCDGDLDAAKIDGIIRYNISQDATLKGGENRGGGV